jgi:hypothetical protein
MATGDAGFGRVRWRGRPSSLDVAGILRILAFDRQSATLSIAFKMIASAGRGVTSNCRSPTVYTSPLGVRREDHSAPARHDHKERTNAKSRDHQLGVLGGAAGFAGLSPVRTWLAYSSARCARAVCAAVMGGYQSTCDLRSQ